MYVKQSEEGGCGRKGTAVDSEGRIDQSVTGPMSAEAVNTASVAFNKTSVNSTP